MNCNATQVKTICNLENSDYEYLKGTIKELQRIYNILKQDKFLNSNNSFFMFLFGIF
jgi:hypothetical protein